MIDMVHRMPHKALIVVDVQNDFCPGGSLAVPNGDQVVAPLNRLVMALSGTSNPIFYSRDWHPAETSHFKEFGGVWPPHCVQYTHGADFPLDLVISASAIIVSKGTKPDENAYSAFDGDYLGMRLHEILLRRYYVGAAYVGGLATDYCVKATALEAVRLGYETFLVIDACRAVNVNSGDGERAIEEMHNAGVKIVTSEEVLHDYAGG